MSDATTYQRPAIPWAVRLALGFIAVFVLFALFGQWLSPHEFRATSLLDRLRPPVGFGGTWDYPLGTDARGRDLLVRLAVGAQITLIVAVVGTLIGAVLGSLLGVLAAARRGFVETVVVGAVDVQASLPIIVVALFVLAMFDSSFTLFLLLIGLTGWEVYARLMRGAVLSAKEQGYVTAVRALGASPYRIYLRHILPNVVSVALVQFTVNMPLTVLLETALSFLGLGVQSPLTSLGQIMSEGRDRLLTAWWLTLFPGVIIFLLALSISLVGDWVRDRFDPTLRSEN
ncbi:ABC transporter permease [Alterinioella nitratireducens]|uniref:ABC transporter permease n=1 Tax=Alterinioella nitratireducens TaxID=2735915 RepID=UPI001556F305|nr:ABC transporter permease [Alterinioella nitratireducens]NPD20687.1 ABC transporter permease [Alterinioella nitratireducens]